VIVGSRIVACPECGAEVGEVCRERPPGTAVTWSHLDRNLAASAARRAKRQPLFTDRDLGSPFAHTRVLVAFALGLLVGVCLAAPLVIIGLRPSPECAETCEVLDSEAVIQVGHTVWCHDPVSTFPTDCAE
jgi:hypothetical protein